MFARELEERMKVIAHNTRCRVYSASYNPRYMYPYRLAKCTKVTPALRNSCYELMLDSAFEDPSITNADVIEKAITHNADYVFPKDYPGDADRTLASLKEFLELADAHSDFATASVIPIIQYPYGDHIETHAAFYQQFSHLAIGGLHGYTPPEQIKIIRRAREAVGDHTHLHGFGIGMSLPMLQTLRQEDHLLDSLDVSTAEMAIRTGKIPDATLTQHTFNTPYGDDSSTIRAQFAQSILTMFNYLLSDLVDENRMADIYHEETPFDDLQQAVTNATIESRHEITTPSPMDAAQSTTLDSFLST